MPLSDMFSDGLVQPALNWAKQNNLGSALGTMALAIPIAMAAQSMSKRRDRAGAAGGVYRMFGNLAFDQMQRPQRTRDALTLQQIQKGDMTLTPPNAGATPAGDMYGQPYYQAPTLAQQYPDLFKSTTTPAQFLAPKGGPLLQDSPTMDPSTSNANDVTWLGTSSPKTTGTSPSMQIAGGMKGPEALRALIGILAKKETTQDALAQQQQGFQQFQEQVAGNPDLETSYGYGKGGLSMKASPPKAGSVSKASLAKEKFKNDPAKMDKFLLDEGNNSQKQQVRDMPMTTADGKRVRIPHQLNTATGKWEPIAGMGAAMDSSKPNNDAARMEANAELSTVNAEINMLARAIAEPGLASKKEPLRKTKAELEARRAIIIQNYRQMTQPGGAAPPQNRDQQGAQTIQDLYP